MIVDRDGQRLLRPLLPDHVLVEYILDLHGCGDLSDRLGDLALFILGKDLVAQRDALVADVDGWAGNELPNRVLGLSAERTAEVFVVRGHSGRRKRRVKRERDAPAERSARRGSLTLTTRGPNGQWC